jgi:hypothetical protein
MYHRLSDEAGVLDTSRRPIPSAPAIDVKDSSSYQQTFLRLIRLNQPKEAIDLIAKVPGAEWNFLYEDSMLSPLSCLVSPEYSNLDQSSVIAVIDALTIAGASITFGACTSHPACLHDAAFIAASFGQDQVVKRLLDLGYPIDRESAPAPTHSSYFATLLHAAASCSSLRTMELLVKRGIYCSRTDQLGRTALHLALDVAPDLDTCLFLQHRAHLDPFQPDRIGNTPFAMSVVVLADYAASIIEDQSKKNKQLKDGAIWKYDFLNLIIDEDGNAVDFLDYTPASEGGGEGGAHHLGEVLHNLAIPIQQSLHHQPQPIRYTAVQLMVKHSQKQLLVLPLIKMVLKEAWDQFGLRLWRRQLVEYVLFLSLFLTLSHIWPNVDTVHHASSLHLFLYPLTLLVAVMALRLLLVQLRSLVRGGRKLWAASHWDVVNFAIDVVVSVIVTCQLAVLLGYRSFWGPYWVNLSAFMHIILGLKLLRFACIPKETGAMVAMIASLIREIVRFMVFFLTFFLPFASAYYLLFKEGYQVGFRTIMVTLSRWLFGDIEFGIFGDRLPDDNVHTAQIIFILYMVMVGIALLNILIALISNTFNAVIENAEGEWILVFAKEIVEIMEASCTPNMIDAYHRALLQKTGRPLFYEIAGPAEANWVQVLRERMLHLNKQHHAMATRMNDIHAALDRLNTDRKRDDADL